MNNGVLLLSPVFLTRIFQHDLQAYGQYREFVLYALLFSGIVSFGVFPSLLYFIPKYPGRERESLTNSTLLVFALSLVGSIGLLLGGDLLRSRTSFDFVYPLIAYTFFFINVDFFESYWLGKKRTDYVLYFSTARMTIRTAAIIVVAYVTRSVGSILTAMVAVEIVKCVFMLGLFRRSFAPSIDFPLLREQLRFIVPIGSASLISIVNSQLANLTISIKMGVERLALYSAGNHQIPVINIIRSSVMDVLFPEMTQTDDEGRLNLWRRANVVFCFLIFPVWVVFFHFAGTFISLIWTADYLAAVPIFRIYLTVILIQCFEMGTPLRAINQTTYFMFGSILTLVVNIGFILAFFGAVGFLTPAFAYILGETAAALYIARMILVLYRLGPRRLFLWSKILRIVLASLAAAPALFAGRLLELPAVAEAIVFSAAYLAIYFLIVRAFRIEEVEILVKKVRARLRA